MSRKQAAGVRLDDASFPQAPPSLGYVNLLPPELWGRDHWSTLAYIETKLVDDNGYKVVFDPHMRQNRRNWRVLGDVARSRGRSTQNGIPTWKVPLGSEKLTR